MENQIKGLRVIYIPSDNLDNGTIQLGSESLKYIKISKILQFSMLLSKI